MIYVYLTVVILIVCFSAILLFGAPYLPTLAKQKETALDMLDLKKGQILLEPGSGDGRVLIAAAKRDIKAIGIELNPILFVFSWLFTFRYRKNVKVIWGNFWTKEWPEADGVFLFLIAKYMPKFDQKLTASQRTPTKVASFAFKIPGKKIARQKNGVFLYKYD